jgi:hypothetical protein
MQFRLFTRHGPRGICFQVQGQGTTTTTASNGTTLSVGGQQQSSSGSQNSNLTTSGTQATTGSTAGTTAQQQAQQNTYTAGQQALQGTATGAAGQFLTTGIAPGLQQEIAAENAAYQQNFNTDVAPQLAAQYGAGSPVIAGQEEMGLVNLIGNAYQNQAAQFNSALGTAGSLAFNPTGSTGQATTSSQATNNQTTSTQQQQQQTQNWQQAMTEAQEMASNASSYGTGAVT